MARKGKQEGSQRSAVSSQPKGVHYAEQPERVIALGHSPPSSGLRRTSPLDGLVLEENIFTTETQGAQKGEAVADSKLQHSSTPSSSPVQPLTPIYRDDAHGIWLYQGNCLAIMDAIAAKHPDGCFDMIFADPPYFLSNGGITCHAGRMVKVDKGDWDKSRGPELNHEFNTEWLKRCQRVLKPNGTIWVTGTHHVIFSVGYAMQQLGMKILNDIAWESRAARVAARRRCVVSTPAGCVEREREASNPIRRRTCRVGISRTRPRPCSGPRRTRRVVTCSTTGR